MLQAKQFCHISRAINLCPIQSSLRLDDESRMSDCSFACPSYRSAFMQTVIDSQTSYIFLTISLAHFCFCHVILDRGESNAMMRASYANLYILSCLHSLLWLVYIIWNKTRVGDGCIYIWYSFWRFSWINYLPVSYNQIERIHRNKMYNYY